MKALSIRQPWAWLILNAGKDIENRNWQTSFRGRFLIHAAKGMTYEEYNGAMMFATERSRLLFRMPSFESLQRGGIIGSVELSDCVFNSESPWFCGSYGFVLRDPRPIEFIPYKGQLGFFDVDYYEQ